jgi:hypothetical protein
MTYKAITVPFLITVVLRHHVWRHLLRFQMRLMITIATFL